MPTLKETRAGQTGARHSFRRVSLSQVLVSGQRAISLLMLVAAGFNRDNVLLFELTAAPAGHKSPEISAFFGNLRETPERDPRRTERESLKPFPDPGGLCTPS
jgi:hypothetical protein